MAPPACAVPGSGGLVGWPVKARPPQVSSRPRPSPNDTSGLQRANAQSQDYRLPACNPSLGFEHGADAHDLLRQSLEHLARGLFEKTDLGTDLGRDLQ